MRSGLGLPQIRGRCDQRFQRLIVRFNADSDHVPESEEVRMLTVEQRRAEATAALTSAREVETFAEKNTLLLQATVGMLLAIDDRLRDLACRSGTGRGVTRSSE
jgi:hypothetical protein